MEIYRVVQPPLQFTFRTFSSLQKDPSPFALTPNSHAQPQATANLLSLSVDLSFLHISDPRNHTLYGLWCLVSFTTTVLLDHSFIIYHPYLPPGEKPNFIKILPKDRNEILRNMILSGTVEF